MTAEPIPTAAERIDRIERIADPTVLTTAMIQTSLTQVQREAALHEKAQKNELQLRKSIREREHTSLQELLDTRIVGVEALHLEKLDSVRREMEIHEAHRMESKIDGDDHRKELKADADKALTTALTAAKEAVREALSASEKARDQQNIANQLAADKAEQAFTKAMALQGATFTAAIGSLTDGLGEVKSALIALTSEKRGGLEQTTDRRAGTGLWVGILGAAVAFSGVIIAAIALLAR